MAKKPWLIVGTLVLGAVGAESSRRLFFAPDANPTVTEESLAQSTPVTLPAKPEIEIPVEILTKEADIRKLFDEKKFDEASALIASELRRTVSSETERVYQDWLQRQRWVIKTAQAWVFLEKQNCSAAMTILEEIPENSRPDIALKGMGYCRLLMRDWQGADGLLSRFLETKGHDHEAIQMLAKTKEAQGLYDEALDLTESLKTVEAEETSALEIEPLRKSILAKQNESLNQLVREGSFFTLHYQPNIGPEFIDKVVETLTRTATKLNLDFGIDYPERSIDIFFHDAERFGEITHGPEWSAGMYDGQIRLPIASDGIFSESVARAVRHEMTHALISEMVQRRNLPTWFQEGFAQLAECEQICMQYEYAATTQKFMPIEKFEQSFLSLPTREAQVAYKQSHYMTILLVHYRKEADIKQMFSLLPRSEILTSQEIVSLAGWDFSLLHKSAKNAWEGQISIKNLTVPN